MDLSNRGTSKEGSFLCYCYETTFHGANALNLIFLLCGMVGIFVISNNSEGIEM